MHDIRSIRENPAAFDASLARRGLPGQADDLLAVDTARRATILAAETAQAAQNAVSKDAGAAKAAGNSAEFERLRALVSEKKDEIARLNDKAATEDAKLRDMLMRIPNLPLAEVPEGADETENVEIRRWGTPRVLDFTPKEHFEIAGCKPGMDFATAAKLSGARFVVLKGTRPALASKKIGPVASRAPAGDSDRVAAAKAEVLRLLESNKQAAAIESAVSVPAAEVATPIQEVLGSIEEVLPPALELSAHESPAILEKSPVHAELFALEK